MDIRFYLDLLLRRLHYVVLFVVLGTALGLTVALILPPRYVAEARLVVESQQIPDELAASTVMVQAGEQLQIIRQRILARSNLLDMAEEFGVYDGSAADPLSPDEKVSDMRSRIDIRTSGGGRGDNATLVDVSFSAERANLSAAVANQVVTLILEENVEMRTTVSGQTVEFFESEVGRLEQVLAQLGARVSDFQQQNRDALPESLEFRRGQLVAAQERAIGIARDIDQLEDRRTSLQLLYAQTGGLGLASQVEQSAEARELLRLRERFAASAAVMSEANPRRRILSEQIAVLEGIVAEQVFGSGDDEDGTAAPSPYDLQITDIENQIAFLEEQRARIAEQMEELTETINATPNNAIVLGGLQRDLENTRSQYDQAVSARARAEIGDTIEALSKGQRISIIENAIAPGQPNSPDRRKIVLAGFGGGLMAGLGLLVLLELLNSSVRRAVEIERALDITPIATLSYMRTRREILRRRLLIGAALAVVAAGVPLGIWAVDTYVKPVDLLIQDILDQLPNLSVLTGNRIEGFDGAHPDRHRQGPRRPRGARPGPCLRAPARAPPDPRRPTPCAPHGRRFPGGAARRAACAPAAFPPSRAGRRPPSSTGCGPGWCSGCRRKAGARSPSSRPPRATASPPSPRTSPSAAPGRRICAPCWWSWTCAAPGSVRSWTCPTGSTCRGCWPARRNWPITRCGCATT